MDKDTVTINLPARQARNLLILLQRGEFRLSLAEAQEAVAIAGVIARALEPQPGPPDEPGEDRA